MLVGVGRADPVPEMEGLRLPVTEAPVDKVAVVVLLGVKVGEAVTLEEGVTAPEFVVDMVALVVVVIVLLGVTCAVCDSVIAAVREAVCV